jgi:hypothetical protein
LDIVLIGVDVVFGRRLFGRPNTRMFARRLGGRVKGSLRNRIFVEELQC